MIFSLSASPGERPPFELENTDLFSFVGIANAVQLPADQWLRGVCTSLKLKRNVLILNEALLAVPELDLKLRWKVDDAYLWLAPRALRVLLEAPHETSSSYQNLKSHLKTFK